MSISFFQSPKKRIITAFVAVLLLLSVGSTLLNRVVAAGPITGWLWSDTIGWVSLSPTNDHDYTQAGVQTSPRSYGVTQQADGSWTGYGWADTVGWLKFDAGCPSGYSGECSAKVVGTELRGWARFCAGTVSGDCNGASRTDWDGWVSLSSTNTPGSPAYGITVNGANIDGYAWGSDVVGWLYMLQTECSDGIDNDDPEDTAIDMADPGCSSPQDDSEANGECSDGVDNLDPEDTDADIADNGCWTDPTDQLTYDPNDLSEEYAANYALNVTKNGSASNLGSVTSNVAGIGCGADCTEMYASGTTVVLTASIAPANGTFAGWSGEGCSGTGTCSVTMSQSRNVVATFNAGVSSYTLTVSKAGAGSGTITTSPAGISCGGTCAAAFSSGATVTLTPAPASGSTFAGWGGDADCSDGSVTMNADKSCTATFNIAAVDPQCNDDDDNDGDGLIDELDPGCWTDPDDPLTYDPTDNDERNKKKPIYIEF